MNSKSSQLKGVLPALITPYGSRGLLDENLLVKQAEYLIGAGVNGLFLTGTTSEGAYLTNDEKAGILRIIKNRTEGQDLLLCSALLEKDTNSALRAIDAIGPMNPDFISAIVPLYMNPTQDDIVYHFTTIADYSPVPLILYDIPQNTHHKISYESVLELMNHPNIAGIKDSSGDFINFQKGLFAAKNKDFTWIMGEDLLDSAALFAGCDCLVTGLGNARIEPYVQMYRSFLENDMKGVLHQQSQIIDLAGIILAAGGKAIPAIKYAAEYNGRSSSRMRIASMELSSSEKKCVERVLNGLTVGNRVI